SADSGSRTASVLDCRAGSGSPRAPTQAFSIQQLPATGEPTKACRTGHVKKQRARQKTTVRSPAAVGEVSQRVVREQEAVLLGDEMTHFAELAHAETDG